MAYNLESLVQILEQMLLPDKDFRGPWILDSNDRSLIESLLTKVCFLKDFFENTSSITGPEVRRLESRIRDTVYHAENVIGFRLADKQLLKKEGENLRVSPPTELLQIIDDHEFGCILDDMVKIMDETQKRTCASSSLVSPTQDLNPNKIVVGISEVLIQFKDRLTASLYTFEVIPIVGIGGIGKTTLAKTLYDDPCVASHFDIRAWVTISQSYNVQEIMISLLKCDSGNSIDAVTAKDKDKLSLRLHKFLFGRRYLIVLDDMWSPDVWVEINAFFPKTDGSRILVTTREHSVATCFGSNNLHHQMDFLSEVESWNLLSKRVFAEERCPPELEIVGKNISRDCRGLPLAINVVGGILSQLERTGESWVQVAKDVCTSLTDDSDGEFSNILSLSYHHLPNYLKPCFLYMSAFPEDHIIRSSKLIKLWVAEGFLKPILGKSLEEVAEAYLRELVQRNLLLVQQQETKWNVKSYIMHDVLRDLCIRRAKEEKFLYVVNDTVQNPNLNDPMPHWRRLSFHSDEHNHMLTNKSTYFASSTRTVIFFMSGISSKFDPWEHPGLLSLRILCVLDILAVRLPMLPESVRELVNLRYLATYLHWGFSPYSISDLCNLQTLILCGDRFFSMKLELFDLPRLRHLKFKRSYPIYCVQDGDHNVTLQENLRTLSGVVIDDSFPMLLEATPNLKKLGIHVGGNSENTSTSSIDLTCLCKLETLECTCYFHEFLVNFPLSITKLTLRECRLIPTLMERVGALPKLQILILRDCIFENSIWEPTEGEFCQLRHLVFEDVDLVKWIADETHYPRLEHLLIQDCSLLEEIPREIGDIPTLEIIELQGLRTDALSESARRIREEQEELGNNVLQVHIKKTWEGRPFKSNFALRLRRIENT